MIVTNISSTILIVGGGAIGARHLEGLSKCSAPLKIYVLDHNSDQLLRIQQHWLEVVDAKNIDVCVNFTNEIHECPEFVDIAIICTTALKELKLVDHVKNRIAVRYWILEKLLEQSPAEVDNLLSILKGARVWVNTPRRMLTWHKQIRDFLVKQTPLHLTVTGTAWGLACNSIHFLDMFAWLTGETLSGVDTSNLPYNWIKAKRKGNWEILGELSSNFSGGSTARFSVEQGNPANPSYQFHLEDGDLYWSIDEESGTAIRSDNLAIPGRLPYQVR